MAAPLLLYLWVSIGAVMMPSFVAASENASAAANPSSIAATTIKDKSLTGSVHFFELENFKGYSIEVQVHWANTCYNIECFDNRASSAWWDLPADGNFSGDAYLGFYDDPDCRGMMHLFNLRHKELVTELATWSKLNKKVSSFMVLSTATYPLHYVLECANDTHGYSSA